VTVYFGHEVGGLVTTYEIWAIVFSGVTIGIAAAGLWGLWRYVSKTTDIAKATELQSEILNKPAVSVKIASFPPGSYEGTGLYPFEHVGVNVENHTTVHANIKIKFKYRLRTGDSEHWEEFCAAGNYGGGDVWNLAAKATFFGHLMLTKLHGREITPSDDLIVDIVVESSPFNKDEYRANPPIQYRWKHIVREWVPYPVPIE